MDLQSLIAFNLVLLAALASPGAAMLYVIKTTVSAGRLAGILTGLGLGTAAACWTLAAFLGLESLFALFPWAYTLLKIGGALYLIWIAVQTWRHARALPADAPTPKARSVIAGMLVNFGNPKSMLFAAAVILVVFPAPLDWHQIALVVANHLVLEILFYTVFATMLSLPAARRGYLRLKPVFDRIAATLLGGFGLKLMIER
ncbi:LysE family translocator [Sulfitobacter sp. JB4-11]|uniref:LysE family translocator n=1 Tax=Sulfitobacter rhodophyticola TaxID=3238304 RepID=UPI00351420C5